MSAPSGRPVRHFKRYPAYKDSGVQWLGEIPAHWEVKKLGRLTECLDGRRIPLNAEQRGAKHGEYPYWGANSILDYVDDWLFDEELVLLGEDGAPFFDRSRPVAFRVSGRIWVNNHAHVLRARPTVGASYLTHVLNVVDYCAFIDGTTRDKLTQGDMRNIPIQVAPVTEQRDIATFLDRETARIDALVAKKERLIGLLQEKRTALITRAVTKGLDPNVPMKGSGVEWLGEIPAHWAVKRVRNFVNWIEQGWSPECENREAADDEWGVLKAGCVNRGVFLQSEHKALPPTLEPIEELEIRPGDLLMNRASGSRELVGSVAVVAECRSQLLLCDKVFRLHTNPSAADRSFIAYAMNSRPVRWQIEAVLSGGSGLASNIAQEVVKDLTVAMPVRDEQGVIAAFLDRETAKLDALVAKVRDAIDRLRELRTALITAAVTGRIDVRSDAARPHL